jgi:cystathionine beta-lyase
LASISAEIGRRTVTLTSATKSFGFAGLRCGIVHFGSKSLKQRFDNRIHPRLLGTVGVTGIDATVAAWMNGDSWFAGALQHLQSNRDFLVETIRRDLPEVKVRSPEATYLAWLDFSGLGLPENPYDFFLKRARVAMSPGTLFDPACDHFARINFATTQPILAEALARMIKAVRDQ